MVIYWDTLFAESLNCEHQNICVFKRRGRMAFNVIQLAVLAFGLIPFTITPLCLWVGLDPFGYTFSNIIEIFQICNSTYNFACVFAQFIMFVCRISCSIICVTEACRFFSLLFCMLIYIVELEIGCIEIL